MGFAKTIKIFLIDGDPNGRMSCELSNWTGKAYKIPRIKVKDCTDRDDLGNTGIYLLFGKDDDGRDQVYIGEAESVLKRLNQQIGSKEFWNEAIVFISKDENLNKAHVKYLENRLFELAKNAKRYQIENSVIPTQSSISESDRVEMEEFLSNIKMLVNTLGHKVFEEKRELNLSEKRKQSVFYLKGARGAEGHGAPTSDGFVVFKGSKASISTVDSMPVGQIQQRERLLKEGILKEIDDALIFSEDYIFSSPSTAAMVLMGRTANGLIEWKLQNGTTLKDFESKK